MGWWTDEQPLLILSFTTAGKKVSGYSNHVTMNKLSRMNMLGISHIKPEAQDLKTRKGSLKELI